MAGIDKTKFKEFFPDEPKQEKFTREDFEPKKDKEFIEFHSNTDFDGIEADSRNDEQDIGELFIPRRREEGIPFVDIEGLDFPFASVLPQLNEEGKQFFQAAIARSEAERQSSVQNFVNAGYKALVPQSKAAYLELFGFHDEALSVLQEASIEFPTRDGTSEFLGNLAGGLTPQLVAMATAVFAPPIGAPLLAAVMANYGFQAAGGGLAKVRGFEDMSGKEISLPVKALVATGYGVLVYAAERVGMKRLRGVVDDLTGAALREVGEAYMTGSGREVGKVIVRNFLKIPTGAAIIETGEEIGEQVGTNTIDKFAHLIDETYQSSGFFDNVEEAALQGLVGGFVLGGAQGALQISSPSFRRGAIDGFSSKPSAEASLFVPTDASLQDVGEITTQETPIDKIIRGEVDIEFREGVFEQIEKAFPNLTAEEVDLGVFLLEAKAEGRGLNLQDWFDANFHPEGFIKGISGDFITQTLPSGYSSKTSQELEAEGIDTGQPAEVFVIENKTGRVIGAGDTRLDAISDAAENDFNFGELMLGSLLGTATRTFAPTNAEGIKDGDFFNPTDLLKSVIRGFDNADFPTLVHEIGHVFRWDLSEEHLKILNKAYGETSIRWVRANEERFAEDFTNFIKTGKVKNPKLTPIFERMKAWLSNMFMFFKHAGSHIAPEVEAVFNEMLGSPTMGDKLIKNLDSNMVQTLQKANIRGQLQDLQGALAPIDINTGKVNTELIDSDEILNSRDNIRKNIATLLNVTEEEVTPIVDAIEPHMTLGEFLKNIQEGLSSNTTFNLSVNRNNQERQKRTILDEDKRMIDVVTTTIKEENVAVENLNALQRKVHETKEFARQWARTMIDVFDVESKFKRVGLERVGRAIKNMFSVRGVYEEEGIEVIKKVVGALGIGKRKYLNRVILYAEDPKLLGNIPKKDIAAVQKATDILREYFDRSLTEYQERGGLGQGFKQNLIDRLNKDLARAESKSDENEIIAIQKELLKAEDMEFVHIPYGIWFEDMVGRDHTRSRKFLKILEQAPRKTVLIQDLVDEGVIDAKDVKLADVIASYSRRKGFDFSLLNIVNAAIAEGAALKLEKGKKPQAGFVVAPSSAPVLKGYQVHPILAEFISETTISPPKLVAWRRFMNIAKMSAFINPFFLPIYDTIQAVMLGTISPLRPFKTMRYVIEGINDVWNKTPEYYRAKLAGSTSTPYNNPLSSARQEAEAATQLGGIFQFYLTKNFDASAEGIAKGLVTLPANMFKLAYNLSWKIAWGLDGTMRQISTRFLVENQGMTWEDAAQKAALYHGDYASVPTATRKQLNSVFFTPTFKIAMAKLFLKIMTDAGSIIKADQNVDSYENAKAVVRIAGILTAMDALMLTMGWERDEFGRKYTRLTDTDEGTKELVLTWSGPHNLFQKYITRWFQSTRPDVTNSLESYFRANSWELHPIIRAGTALFMNEDRNGKEIWRPFMSGREKALRGTHYVLTEIVALYRLVFAEGAETPEAVAAFKKEAGQLMEMVSSGFTFKYLRSAPDQKLERDMQKIIGLINKYASDPDIDFSPEELDNAIDRLDKIIENFDEKNRLMNEPFDIVDDRRLQQEKTPPRSSKDDFIDFFEDE